MRYPRRQPHAGSTTLRASHDTHVNGSEEEGLGSSEMRVAVCC